MTNVKRPDVSVIILNWNTCQLLKDCLETLTQPQSDASNIDVQIIVVDNASEDDSREMVSTLFPHVTLQFNHTNIGFGAGNNTALSMADGRYVLFLNSDTKVMEGALSTLVAYGDTHPDVGILGPKLLNADGSLQYSCRRYPQLLTGFFRNTPLGRLFPQNRFTTDYLMQDWDHASPRDVDWVSGAALMIRRELLDQIGSFDEEYYMYCEDVDLCWRANHAPHTFTSNAVSLNGSTSKSSSIDNVSNDSSPSRTWRVTYLPDAVIYHFIGKSSDQVPTRMTYEFHRSQYLFYKKHYAARTPLLLRPIILPGIALRAIGQILRYRFRHMKHKLMLWRQRHVKAEITASQTNQVSTINQGSQLNKANKTANQAASHTGGSRPGDAS